MEYNNEKHLKLIEQYLNLKKQNKNLLYENRKAASELTYYEIQLYNHIFWTKKTHFVLLMQNYIDNLITLENFEAEFSFLWYSKMEKLQAIKLDLEWLKNFYPSPQSENFGTYITAVFRQFEELDDEVCNEQEARDFIIHILDQIQ